VVTQSEHAALRRAPLLPPGAGVRSVHIVDRGPLKRLVGYRPPALSAPKDPQ
jgi:hypothetical protein